MRCLLLCAALLAVPLGACTTSIKLGLNEAEIEPAFAFQEASLRPVDPSRPADTDMTCEAISAETDVLGSLLARTPGDDPNATALSARRAHLLAMASQKSCATLAMRPA